jgi:hypothetical protein
MVKIAMLIRGMNMAMNLIMAVNVQRPDLLVRHSKSYIESRDPNGCIGASPHAWVWHDLELSPMANRRSRIKTISI